MRFLKLLDPWMTQEGRSLSPGEQQRLAQERFPGLVAQSCLNYFNPTDSHISDQRLLIGLAASYSLRDLRLADVLNEWIANGKTSYHVDVFNVEDLRSLQDLQALFGLRGYIVTPVVQRWANGKPIECAHGFEGLCLALRSVGIRGDPHAILGELCPPSPDLLG